MPDADPFIDVDGARLRVRAAGNGPAVLFVHGWALDLDMWRPQFAALAHRYRVIAFDRRGYGLSSGSPSIDRDAADVGRILDAMGVRSVAIVGMSQGARVALRCAVELSERVSCIVLDGPPREAGNASGGSSEIPIADFRALMHGGGIAQVRQRWLQHPLMRLHTTDTVTPALLREIVGRYPGNDLLAEPSAEEGVNLATIATPALVINGEHDSQQRREAAVEVSRALPNAQRVTVTGAGHLSNLDAPLEYNRRLHDFFNEHMIAATRNRPPRQRSTHHAE